MHLSRFTLPFVAEPEQRQNEDGNGCSGRRDHNKRPQVLVENMRIKERADIVGQGRREIAYGQEGGKGEALGPWRAVVGGECERGHHGKHSSKPAPK